MLSFILWIGTLVAVTAPQEAPRFRSHTDLVVLHVSVLTGRTGHLAGLPQDAFTILEDGEPQTITFFENTDTPATLGVVVDNSISMMRRKPAIIEAAEEFARAGHPGDELFVIHFNEHVRHALPPDVPFTSDRDVMAGALQRMIARGQTALFDAVREGLRHLARGTRQKKVLVVLSDGGDNASSTSFDDVLAAALRMDAVIYTVSLHDPYDREANPNLLRRLADETGGEAIFVRNPDELPRVLERVARDIRSGYTIGYVPSRAAHDGAYRAITVKVAPQDGKRVKVRARSGYVAEATRAGGS